MKLTRREFSFSAGTAIIAAATPKMSAPALAQDKPLRIGIIAPRSGAAGTAGECGIRGVQWAAERMNKDGGIAGRKIELVFEEETNPKDTIERFRRLILQEKVEAVHGLISTGVSLGVAPVAEEEAAAAAPVAGAVAGWTLEQETVAAGVETRSTEAAAGRAAAAAAARAAERRCPPAGCGWR